VRISLVILLVSMLCGCFSKTRLPEAEVAVIPSVEEEIPQLDVPQVHPSDFDNPNIK